MCVRVCDAPDNTPTHKHTSWMSYVVATATKLLLVIPARQLPLNINTTGKIVNKYYDKTWDILFGAFWNCSGSDVKYMNMTLCFFFFYGLRTSHGPKLYLYGMKS